VLNSFDGDIISSSSNVGTFLIKDFRASKISDHTAKELVQLNPNTIVGPIEHEGFGVFEKINGRWEFKTQFQTFPNLFNPIVDSNQNIWANDNNQSIIRFKLNATNDSIVDISIFDTIPGLSSFKKVNIFLLNGSIMLGSASGTFKLVNNQFIPYTEFNNEVGSNFHIQTKKIDLHGQEWVMGLKDGVEVVGRIVKKYGNSSELEVVKEKKEAEKFEVELNLLPIARISDYLLFSFYPIDNQNILFGSSEKIIQYNPSQNQLCNDNFTVLIRSVETIKPFDSLLFGGTFLHNGKPINSKPETNYPSIKFVNNALRIKYAAIFFEGNEKNLYQIMLEGFDHEWSDWSAKAEKEYSYLKEGSYRFCVRAKNVYGIISPVTYYSFIILPPWYRTIWALLFYIAITAVTIILIVRISIYRLRKEKIKLEKIVAQRTAEILEQKEEIMVQNQVLLQNSEEILAQNELLNEQKDEILAQSETLKEKNKKITDQNFEITESIKYASTIQMALLTSNELVSILIPENFIIYKPLHIVSGDFYWIKKVNDVIVIAIADCTGHGVPGAFMSMLGIAYLNEIVRNHEVKEASQVLFEMRRQIKLSLGQTGNNILSRDGMDLALVVIYKDKCEMEYAGAQIPLILFRQVDGKKKLIEFKPDPMPIGVHLNEKDTFTNHIIPIDPSDTIYLFTDGYTDQFHSEGNLKFSRAKLKELLSHIQDEPLVEQKDILELALKEWAGNRPQVDDILVAGFGIGALFEKKLEK
jgi:serine phosphatase RsbU (regulator of sigma subunit)